MLLKWKTILNNWINCYFNENDDKAQSLTLESLLLIISHLRENLNLDESKSSLLEAHSVEEFIQEKYPEFRFDNGTVETYSDDEMYMVASLLLFFVCVNSKDIDIKNAMCSNLSAEDQEVILRFSKCLMECSSITCKDVQTAITDACGPLAVDAGNARQMVSETPPALRSLHGEVRRLQAALDAERFDRNYLQDELARTNLTVEKLTKDREQYKLDIVNLKAKISMCCGQEAESKAGDKAAEGTTKLVKELQQMEEKLVETQGLLEDAYYERDTYKAKVNELKQERDKWLSLSQQEMSRASQLSEQLDSERRYVQSLKELVEELRQHRQLNRLDSSQLECDDPDASVQSLNHNSSICSEACANVVEVQLAEERAKIVLLKQQIQTLQEQLNDLSHRSESEILSLNKIVSEKDSELFDLKHRINEEIEARNKLEVHYSDENSKLNNEINELEQRLKDNNNHSRLVIEMKMQEIQTLQEEKLSLLQSLTDETTKLEGIIENVKSELAAEENSKLKLRDDYENHIMKLNEKVLNRNNELVELQNNVFAKSEHIEELNLELRKERQTRETFVEQCHSELKLLNERRVDAENALKQKCDENESLMDRLNNNYTYTEELSKELNQLKTSHSQLIENCNSLEETKAMLINEIQIRDNRLDEQCKKIENCINVSSEERNNYTKNVEAFETRIIELTETIDETRAEMSRQRDSYKTVLESRARDIQTLQGESQSLREELNDVKHQLELKVHSLDEKLLDNEKLTEKLKQSYECQIENLNVMVNKVTNYLKDKTMELDTARKDKERLQEVIDSNNKVIKCLEEEVKSHKSNQEKIISEFETERLVLKNMVTVTESIMKDQKLSLNDVIANHVKDNEALKEELKDLHYKLESIEANVQEKEEISKTLIQELTVLRNDKEKLATDYETQKQHFNTEFVKFNKELAMKVSQLELVELQHRELTDVLQKHSNDLALLDVNKNELTNEIKELKEQNESLISKLTNLELQNKDLKNMLQTSKETITQLEENNNDSMKDNNTLKKEVDFKLSQIKILELKNKELEGLLQTCKRDIEMMEESNNEMKIKKDLQESELTNKVCDISKEFAKQVTVVKILQNKLEDKNKQNMEMEEKLLTLNSELSSVSLLNETIKSERDDYISKFKELESKLNTDTMTLNNQIVELSAEKSKLLNIVEENKLVIKSLEDEVKSEKRKQEKILRDFESQKKILMRKITVSRSVIMKQKENQNKTLSDHAKICTTLKKEIFTLKKSSELCRKKDNYITVLESKAKDVQILQQENESLLNELNDVKQQLDLKVHSLNEKLHDNEKLTEKLKQSYECQIENLNVMVNKVTNYLKDKTSELDTARKDKERLQEIINSNNEVIKRLEDEVQSHKNNQEKFINEFETERLVLKNMITVTESIMKDQKLSLNEVIAKQDKENETLKEELKDLNHKLKLIEANILKKEDFSKSLNQELTVLRNEKEKLDLDNEAQKQKYNTEIAKLNEKLNTKVLQLQLVESQHKELTDVLQKCGDDRVLLEENKKEMINEIKNLKEQNESLLCGLTNLKLKNKELENNFQTSKNIITQLEENNNVLKKDVDLKRSQIKMIEFKNQELEGLLQICKNDILIMEESNNEMKIKRDLQETEFTNKICNISKDLAEQITVNKILVNELEDKNNQNKEAKENLLMSTSELTTIIAERDNYISKVKELESKMNNDTKSLNDQIAKLNAEKGDYISKIKELESKMKNDTKSLNDQIAELNAEKGDYILKIKELESKMNNDTKSLNDQIAEVNAEKGDYILKIKELESKMNNDTKSLNDQIAELNAEKGDYILKIKELESKMNNDTKSLNDQIAEVNAEKGDYILKIKELESKMNNDTKSLNDQIAEVNAEKRDYILKIKELESKMNNDTKSLNDQIAEVNAEKGDYISKIKELESKMYNDTKSLNDQISEVNAEKGDYILKIKELESKMNNDTKSLNNQIAEVNAEKGDYISKIKELESKINDTKSLNDQIAELNAEKGDYISKIKELESKMYNDTKSLNDQIAELNTERDDNISKIKELKSKMNDDIKTLSNQIAVLSAERDDYSSKINELESKLKNDTNTLNDQIVELHAEKNKMLQIVKDNKLEYETKAAKQLEEKNKEIASLEEEIKPLKFKVDNYEKELKDKDSIIKDKEDFIYHIKQELIGEKTAKEKLQIELETKVAMVSELKQKMDDNNSKEVLRALRNEEWVRAIGQKEICAVAGSERTGSSQGHKHSSPLEKDYREFHHQVDNSTSDFTYSSIESIKTVSDLEKIIHDRNRTITTLQSDITYLKSLVADSENKLLDVTKELEVSKENCQQLSNQLKKIVHQKNEEIAELKRQLSKMSVTENRASQIIKVSAKYQAIILKRIAEIKTNTVLKELTNFGNSSNGENELRRSLNAGTVTMEDLENFLETTDKHLRRCSEKQLALQKERDRLTEVNKINESENINLRKFLTELSVSFKTFSNVKDLYTQKLSRVVSVQRTVRREILNLDSQINDAAMCKLERGYAAVMQDLSECVMNLERWVERCIGRTISPEKIRQAFTSDDERASFASVTFQNTSLEVQLDELENSFKKLLEEVVRAQKGEGVRDAQSATVMEVRAEYEDKLNRMKTKMKQLYQEQILVCKEKQREEMSTLERELVKMREKLATSSKMYEDHIKSLTMELWRVGEKFLFKKDELDWMQKKQRSGSLMSLQHVHSSGLVPSQEETVRISDAHSLRSLQVNNNPNPSKREARTLHMSDEEGEVFDNRCLRELATPRRGPPSPPARLSELRWRNSLCPPHLKSSYPAETQFAPALDEEDIKCMGAASLGGRNQRKEVGITAYKKPGPPTPSKNAGRLSATDCELRESLRPEPELPPRKTGTPSRLRALFRSSKNETTEGTPRSRRLSIFRKK